MSREILFRGKRLVYGEWVEGDGIHRPKSINYLGSCWIDGMGERANDWVQVDPATVGQYTGLCDKNGVKIFEGDVVKMVPDDNEEESWLTEVKFEDGAFRVEVNGCDYAYTAIGWIDDEVETQVIGNIHDNPEMVGEKSE